MQLDLEGEIQKLLQHLDEPDAAVHQDAVGFASQQLTRHWMEEMLAATPVPKALAVASPLKIANSEHE